MLEEMLEDLSALSGSIILGDVGPFTLTTTSFQALYGPNRIPDEVCIYIFFIVKYCTFDQPFG